jgi:hypothetical protein
MDTRFDQLIAMLSQHGWQVVHRERDDLDWWADEIWTVESEWSPQGFTVYLTLLVDPLCEGPPRAGHAIWAVGTCLSKPADRLEAEGKPLMSIKHWPRDVPQFLQGLAELRNQSSGTR